MTEVANPWSTVSQAWGHPWHAMCSYLGSFPAAMARSLISTLSDEGDRVLDPFCGRGTTLLEARLLRRRAFASDLNPLATAITRAKNVRVSLDDALSRICDLERRFDLPLYLPEALAQNENILLIYHPNTLARLCYLRRRLLNSEKPVDQFLIGLILGIMHGSERKDGSSSYASVSMPNTFSMPPRYVRRFVQLNGLKRLDRDVFGLMETKLQRLFRHGEPVGPVGVVCHANAKAISRMENFGQHAGEIDLILTSPPYLNVVEYAKQNWIRMWFLEGGASSDLCKLDDTLSLSGWLDLMDEVTVQFRKLLRNGGVIVLVIGDVSRSTNSIVSPAREFIRRCHHRQEFPYVGMINDYSGVGEKTTRVWKRTKGQATSVDRIVILSESVPAFRMDRIQQSLFEIPIHDAFPIDATQLAEQASSFAGLS